MNLRNIKKDIDYVLGAFIEDCSVVAAVNPGVADANVESLIEEAVDLYNYLRDKVSAKTEGPAKTYYQALRKEILEKTDALYARLSDAVKEAVAKAAKAE